MNKENVIIDIVDGIQITVPKDEHDILGYVGCIEKYHKKV